jgi:recombination protein RecA
MKLGSKRPEIEVEAVPTGSLGLDIALGIGGLPKGRVIEIYGPESSGKTTLALHVSPKRQKRGGVCALWMPSMRSIRSMPSKLGV